MQVRPNTIAGNPLLIIFEGTAGQKIQEIDSCGKALNVS
jgi:hypothetical protein